MRRHFFFANFGCVIISGLQFNLTFYVRRQNGCCGVIDMREYEYDDEVDSERDSGDDYNEDEVMCG